MKLSYDNAFKILQKCVTDRELSLAAYDLGLITSPSSGSYNTVTLEDIVDSLENYIEEE